MTITSDSVFDSAVKHATRLNESLQEICKQYKDFSKRLKGYGGLSLEEQKEFDGKIEEFTEGLEKIQRAMKGPLSDLGKNLVRTEDLPSLEKKWKRVKWETEHPYLSFVWNNPWSIPVAAIILGTAYWYSNPEQYVQNFDILKKEGATWVNSWWQNV